MEYHRIGRRKKKKKHGQIRWEVYLLGKETERKFVRSLEKKDVRLRRCTELQQCGTGDGAPRM